MSNIPRQYIYFIFIALFLFIFVIIFSFGILIPEGKGYRLERIELKKANNELREYQNFYSDTLNKLKNLQSKNRRIITAFNATFNPDKFEKQNKKYFSSLKISKLNFTKIEDSFAIYEVNTTSKIDSPRTFYDFLDSINKSDWIISVNFPINFKRDAKLITSSFTMKVYCNNKETNETASVSVAK